MTDRQQFTSPEYRPPKRPIEITNAVYILRRTIEAQLAKLNQLADSQELARLKQLKVKEWSKDLHLNPDGTKISEIDPDLEYVPHSYTSNELDADQQLRIEASLKAVDSAHQPEGPKRSEYGLSA